MALHTILLLAAVNTPFYILLWIILAVSARRRANHRMRRAGPVARPCPETKAEEGMATRNKPVVDVDVDVDVDGAAVTLTVHATPEHQPLRWDPSELYPPLF